MEADRRTKKMRTPLLSDSSPIATLSESTDHQKNPAERTAPPLLKKLTAHRDPRTFVRLLAEDAECLVIDFYSIAPNLREAGIGSARGRKAGQQHKAEYDSTSASCIMDRRIALPHCHHRHYRHKLGFAKPVCDGFVTIVDADGN